MPAYTPRPSQQGLEQNHKGKLGPWRFCDLLFVSGPLDFGVRVGSEEASHSPAEVPLALLPPREDLLQIESVAKQGLEKQLRAQHREERSPRGGEYGAGSRRMKGSRGRREQAARKVR